MISKVLLDTGTEAPTLAIFLGNGKRYFVKLKKVNNINYLYEKNIDQDEEWEDYLAHY